LSSLTGETSFQPNYTPTGVPDCGFDDYLTASGKTEPSGMASATLNAPPFRGPVYETHHVRPVFPRKAQEFTGV